MNSTVVNHVLLTKAPPANYNFSYEQSLYHQNDYTNCQTASPAFSFWLCRPDAASIDGVIHFHRRGKSAISQLFAPFGSYDGRPLSNVAARGVIEVVERTLIDDGVKNIEIVHPAAFYSSNVHWVKSLGNFGFKARHCVNHHLIIDSISYEKKIHLSERRKLTRCKDFEFSLLSVESLKQVYHFIEACRKERNQSLSMGYGELEQVARKLPDRFLLCAIYLGQQLAAASIVVKVTSKCWYQFYPAHSKEFDRESPMVLLTSELYNYGRQQGVEVLDLGTSEIDGQPMKGLITFKSRIGGEISRKSTYYKVV